MSGYWKLVRKNQFNYYFLYWQTLTTAWQRCHLTKKHSMPLHFNEFKMFAYFTLTLNVCKYTHGSALLLWHVNTMQMLSPKCSPKLYRVFTPWIRNGRHWPALVLQTLQWEYLCVHIDDDSEFQSTIRNFLSSSLCHDGLDRYQGTEIFDPFELNDDDSDKIIEYQGELDPDNNYLAQHLSQ